MGKACCARPAVRWYRGKHASVPQAALTHLIRHELCRMMSAFIQTPITLLTFALIPLIIELLSTLPGGRRVRHTRHHAGTEGV
jgi:hypothetical protein